MRGGWKKFQKLAVEQLFCSQEYANCKLRKEKSYLKWFPGRPQELTRGTSEEGI